ncbi:hypothetical protein AAHB57_29845 [Bacillus cereus]
MKPEIIDEFSIDIKDIDEKTIQFIDTNKRELYKNGWILRNRIKRENSTYELTYKKRYKILNNNIEAEVEIAKKLDLVQMSKSFKLKSIGDTLKKY